MAALRSKTPLEGYQDDLWETCDFRRPKESSEAMKIARLQKIALLQNKRAEALFESPVNIDDDYLDQLDPRHYRYVTDEIRKIRGERATDRNIEWILGRRETTATESLRKDTNSKQYPVMMQNVGKSSSPTEYSLPLPTEPRINVQNRREFPELK